MKRINRVVIDTSDSITDLCWLGTEFPTDKSPFNRSGGNLAHRHPYTAVYDLLFAPRRYDRLVLGELGILDNMSMHAWRFYFPHATLFGLEFDEKRIEKARADGLANTHYGHADVSSRSSLFAALNRTQQMFDILIDDSTHLFEHQILFIETGLQFMKPGGMLIVEDVFREWSDDRYRDALQPYYNFFSSGTLLETNHRHAHSPGSEAPCYNNDKLLVLVRNQVPVIKRHPQREENLRRLLQELATDDRK